MKRLWAAFLLFLCAAALCFWQGYHTNRTTLTLHRELSAASSFCREGNEEEAEAHAQAALQAWEESLGLLCVYTVHTRVEELGRTLSSLPPLAQYGSLDQFASECEKALVQVEALRQIDAPTLENIL